MFFTKLTRTVLFGLLSALLVPNTYGQARPSIVADDNKLYPPGFLARLSSLPAEETVQLELIVADTAVFLGWVQENAPGILPKRHGALPNLFTLGPLRKTQVLQLAASGIVSAMEWARTPIEESKQEGLDLSLNRVRLLHRDFPRFSGEGLTASIKENRFDTSDIDFRGRHVVSSFGSGTTAQHATTMATILGGGGNSGPSGRGVAWGASLSSADFSELLPSGDAYFLEEDISVQNHSYGTGIENYYGIETQAYDAFCQRFPEILHVFSSGNSGTEAPELGNYAGLAGFANLTGQFKMSKNTLSVGAADSTGNTVVLSSRGPAFDGRVKPEVVAYGHGGSSGAAAIVSGLALLVQQAFLEKYPGELPASALVKAVLANCAHDVGRQGVDFENGFGNVDALAAVKTVLEGRFLTNKVSLGETFQTPISFPPGTASAKITLAWNDPPAGVNAPKALVNDLDLELVDSASGQVWLPWVLRIFPHADSLRLPAQRGVDTLNNIEQITLDSPAPGTYWVRVSGTGIVEGPQDFSLAWQADTLGSFHWISPVRNDFMLPGQSNLLRWESTMPLPAGNLSFRNIGGGWQTIANGLPLQTGSYSWASPEAPGLYQLRWEIGQQTFQSDTFAVATPLQPKVGFDCPDSLLFFWRGTDGASAYRIFQLGSRYLTPLAGTTDTIFIRDATGKSIRHYAVAPVFDGVTGPLSQVFDYTKQGVACYLKTFYTQSVEGPQARFSAEIGTTYGVLSLVLEKLLNGVFQPIQTYSPVEGLSFSFKDGTLMQGANFFRLKILLENGGEVFSQTETVYYLEREDYLLFPNPTKVGGPVYLLAKQPHDAKFRLMDLLGRVIAEGDFEDEIIMVPVENLIPGCYAVEVVDEQGRRSGKVFVIR